MKKQNFDAELEKYRVKIADLHRQVVENEAKVVGFVRGVVPSMEVWLYVDPYDIVHGWSNKKEMFKPKGREGSWRKFGEIL